MVEIATKILQVFISKMKMAHPCQPRKQKATMTEANNGCEPSDVTKPSEFPKLKRASTAVQKIVKIEIEKMMEPLLEDLRETEIQWLQTESSQQLKAVTYELEKMISHSERKKGRATKNKKFFLRQKIKSFFTKALAKMMLLRIGTQIKIKFPKHTTPGSMKSMLSFTACIDSVLESVQIVDENDDAVIENFKTIASAILTQKLSRVLYNYITGLSMPKVSDITCEDMSVCQPHVQIHRYMCHGACFPDTDELVA